MLFSGESGLAYFIVTCGGGITSNRKLATLLSGHNIEGSGLISMAQELKGGLQSHRVHGAFMCTRSDG